MPRQQRSLSPNHVDKRKQIVEAAQTILLRAGPAACTTREVARETGMNQGLIHYYFASIEEIVETAMDDLLAALMRRLRAVGEHHVDPTERFWAVVEEYLAAFQEEPGLTLLWFDWWVGATRAGHAARVELIQDGLIDLLGELLAEVGVPDAPTRARALFSYVVGTLVRQSIHPQSLERFRPEVANLCGVPPG